MIATAHRSWFDLPVLSEIALTYRCNLKCAFCYAGCNCTSNPTGDSREMSAEEIRTVIDKIFREAKTPSVSFTGGEAMLRPEIFDLIRHAKKTGLRVNLITNGTLIDAAKALRLKEAGLDSAQVSLEGVTAAVHDRITVVRGSFAKTIAAVRFLRDAGVSVHTNTTINRWNLDECAHMPAFVKRELSCDRFSMNLVIPAGSASLDERLVVRYSEIGPHILAIAEASRREGVEFHWYSPTPLCFFNPIAHGLGNKGCSACDGLLSVAANGAVLPCSSYDESVGNIVEQDFGEIWESRRAVQYREKFFARPECAACEHFAVCNGACPLYWRAMGYSEFEKGEPAHVV